MTSRDVVLRIHCSLEFLERLNQLRITGEMCDAKVVSRGGIEKSKEFMAHMNVLSAASPHFKQVFNSDFKEAIVGKVELDMDTDIVEVLLDYMYTYNIEIDESIAARLLPEAAYLQLDRLKERCAEFLIANITATNCIEMWSYACLYSCKKMERLAWKMMCRNFNSLFGSPEFRGLEKDTLLALIADKFLRCRESSVFLGVRNWVRADPENRKQHMKELLSLVRLPLLEKEFLFTTVGKEPLVTSDTDCFQIYVAAIETVARAAPDISRNRGFTQVTATGQWDSGPSFSQAMATCSAVVCKGIIYCAGGAPSVQGLLLQRQLLNGNTAPPHNCQIVALIEDKWVSIACPAPDVGWQLCSMNDTLYAVGVFHGNRNVYAYNDTWKIWRQIHSAIGESGTIVSVTCSDGCIVVAVKESKMIEAYKPDDNDVGFVEICHFPDDVTDSLSLCSVDDQLMLVDHSNAQISVFDFDVNDWTDGAEWKETWSPSSVVECDGRLIVAGGTGTERSEVKVLEDGEWKSLPSLRHARRDCAVAVLDNVVYVLGGTYRGSPLSSVETLRIHDN